MTTWLLVSATSDEARRLAEAGPRRDFLALAARLGATILYRGAGARGGWRGRLMGPHLRQAWHAAGLASSQDRVFADGEHVGIPLLFALAARRRSSPVVMLGHMPGRLWKRALLWLGTRVGPPGVLLVHSRYQLESVRPWLGSGWSIEFVPYQVDTEFWRATRAPLERPLVLAVGSEQRDYATLVEAARDLDADVLIAAGSHWARETASASGSLPPNVRVVTQTLSFRDLRERYADASVVVVPLHDAPNQAGVTTMLEAMSTERPVIVTANRGQTDVTHGPTVRASVAPDVRPTVDRGPRRLRGSASATWTGLYVGVGDVAGLRTALDLVLSDSNLRARLGSAGRDSALADFSFEAYIDALADHVIGVGAERATVEADVAP
ncbi:MAG: glycosyltransferase family 4 protein [Dehalococcoidia bacterium]